jgi:hypothetical protein
MLKPRPPEEDVEEELEVDCSM